VSVIGAMLCMAVGLNVSQAQQPKDVVVTQPVLIYVSAIPGPTTNNQVAYQNWIANVIPQMYSKEIGGTPLVVINQLTNDLGYILQIPYVSQPTSLNSNTAWFVVHVISTNASFKFLPGQLQFVEQSSDSSHLLSKTNLFSDPSYIYAPGSWGIIWGSGGPRFNDTLAAGYWNATPVNEFIFIGAMSKYFVYSSPSDYMVISNYISGLPDFQLTGTWQFTDGDGNVITHASKTLHAKGVYAPGIPSIVDYYPPNGVKVGITAGTNDTWVLQSSPSIQYPFWTDVATVNGGDALVFPTDQYGFWRLRLE